MTARILITALLGLGTLGTAHAHKAWLLPSDTVLSKEGWITVDAAVSNDLFYFNHVPMRLDNLTVTAPDGTTLAPQNATTGKYRSTFDLQLAKPGTYRLAIVTDARRIESFVTVGKPTSEALKTSGKGLELQPITHPNDLFAGEPAKFRFLLDGAPAANLGVTIIPGGSRYRDSQREVLLSTDARGELAVTWPSAGMYWLEATLKEPRRATYVATFEVLPP